MINQKEQLVSTVSEKEDSLELAIAIAEGADDKKADDIVILRVAEVSYLADYFVLVTGFSRAQVRAIAESIEAKVAQKQQKYPRQSEGKVEANWILLDYGDVIVHIFLPQDREFYNLEAFWGHAHKIEFQPELPASNK